MRPRTNKIVTRNRWPWFSLLIDAETPIVFRAYGVTTQALELTAWFNKQQAWGLDVVPPEVYQIDDPAEKRDALAAALDAALPDPMQRAEWMTQRIRRHEGAVGWVLLHRWADPDLEIDAEADYRAGKYAADTDDDAKITAGCAALREVCDGLGIGLARAEKIARAVLARMQTEEPDNEDMAEARVFPGPTR